ncbi:hypothetical protein [Paenibacillus zanthoxyli]|uniref:hypothetical protein n=1 Tax=Paenibacillus zanthoxyli TaxID=369399 RepID=UPI0004AD6F07|nr:hypothetical protein [Paenibacillus zanthoxyli]
MFSFPELERHVRYRSNRNVNYIPEEARESMYESVENFLLVGQVGEAHFSIRPNHLFIQLIAENNRHKKGPASL